MIAKLQHQLGSPLVILFLLWLLVKMSFFLGCVFTLYALYVLYWHQGINPYAVYFSLLMAWILLAGFMA